MHIILFLGSGVSIESGHPNVVTLTKRILSSGKHPIETIFLRALRDYDIKARQLGGTYTSPKNYLKVGEINRTYTSYEDLYYLCEEIALFDWGQHNNAMVPAFMESLLEKFVPLFKQRSKRKRLLEIGKWAHAAKKYINAAVIENLVSPVEIKGLDLIVQLAGNPEVSLDILTLNHDLLVEDLLDREGIGYNDGFSKPDGDIRWFEPDIFLSDSKVKLIKLHGSIDWYSFIFNGDNKMGKISVTGLEQQKDKNGKAVEFLNKSPKVLSGLNKVNYYNSGIYTDIHYHFQRVLYQNNLMIMSGYGWGDDPINNRLMTWLDNRPDNKLILLHRNPQELTERSMIFNRDYANWEKLGKLKPIEKWLSQANLQEVLDACSRNR